MRLIYCSLDDQLGAYLKGLVSVVVASVLTNISFSINCPIPMNGNHISQLVRNVFRPHDTYLSSGPRSMIRIERSYAIYNESMIGTERIGSTDVLLIGGQHFGPDKLFVQKKNAKSFKKITGLHSWNAIHHYALKLAIQPYASLSTKNYSAIHLRSGDSFMMHNDIKLKKKWPWKNEVRVNTTSASVLSCIKSLNTENTYIATDNIKIKQDLEKENANITMSPGRPILTGLYQHYSQTDTNSLFQDWYAIAYAQKLAIFKRSTFSETARLWGKGTYDVIVCE